MMEKLLGKKWFSRDNLLLLVLLGVLLFVIALPVKKEDSGKGRRRKMQRRAGRANGIHTDSDRRSTENMRLS